MKLLILNTIIFLGAFSAQGQNILDGPAPTGEPKKEAAKALVCRDPRFRMVQDCENLVYVDKVQINGEDKDVVYNKKSQAPFTGKCKVCHNNGNLWMYLEYRNGWSYGVDTVYYENGNINLIRSHDTTGLGKEDGTWKFYREDGTLKWEKTFVMGAADGEQRYYFPDSTLEKVEMWKMGQLNGKKQEFYPGGTIKKEIGYKNGKFDGKYITYFKDGKVESEQEYINDKKTGISRYYYENGQLFYTEIHENGLLEGTTERFYANGKKWTVENYKKGVRTGIFEEYYNDDKETIKYRAVYKKGIVVEEHYYDEFGEETAPPAKEEKPAEGNTEGGEQEGGKEGKKGKKDKK